MKPIFSKGVKVVKGKVVQRKQGSSQVKRKKDNERVDIIDSVVRSAGGEAGMRAHYTSETDPEFLKVVMREIQKGRTGPRLAPGQKSKPKILKKMGFDPEEGAYVAERGPFGDPRQQRELPKVKPGRIDQNTSARFSRTTRQEESYDLEDEPVGYRMMDLMHRSQHPEVEGRGASPLSKIIDAMGGKKIPRPLLQELKGLEPVKLEKILVLIKKSKRPSGQKGTNKQSKFNAYMNRHPPEDIPF